MPEGDTIFKVATALRPFLLDKQVVAARAAARFAKLDVLAGTTVTAIEPRGKHLLIAFDNGLALHTHLRMTGSWHRYTPGEKWKKPAHLASVVLEVADSVVVCFSAPIVDLVKSDTTERHPSIKALGPDLLGETFDAEEAFRRLRAPERAQFSLSEALLDQRAMAGVGNIFKNEILFIHRLSPWGKMARLDDDTLREVIATAERLLRFNVEPGQYARVTTDHAPETKGHSHWVYGRAGKPCFRCGSAISCKLQRADLPRYTWWCPTCQALPPRQPGQAAPVIQGAESPD